MTAPTGQETDQPASTYQVTHYMRLPGDGAGWSQVASGEVNADEARAFILERQAAAIAAAGIPAAADKPAGPTAGASEVGQAAALAAGADSGQPGPLPGVE